MIIKSNAFAGLTLLVCAGIAAADTVVVQSSRDNTLYESLTGTLSNGSGPYVFAGMTAGTERRRALLRFDVAAVVPAGATVTSAQLKLNMSKTLSFDLGVGLYRSFKDWGEGASTTGGGGGGGGTVALTGDATWVHRFYDTDLWGTPGGSPEGPSPDYAGTSSASIPVGNQVGSYTWGSTALLVADVQGWLDSPATNFGWFVIADETGTQNAKRFDSRENVTAANRPMLVVTYTPPGCYANCDSSTSAPCLNVNDFVCFLNLFAASSSAANCDGSTTAPVLNVNDFVCFLNAYAAECGVGGAQNCEPRP